MTYSKLKIGLVADDLTRACFSFECRTMSVTPWNHAFVFKCWKPDILFVETTWRGRWDSWRYKMANYPDHPDRNNQDLARVVAAARDANIPTVFWNREDGVHFDRFIDSAKLFDRVLTVDEQMLPRYREALVPDAKIDVMMFAASATLHAPRKHEVLRRASFVGSYSSQHPERKQWQDKMFLSAQAIGMTVYDRNSKQKAVDYRYPPHPWIDVRRAVPHARIADIYCLHAVNLNVNTITESGTAFSRRLVEIIATGSLALSNITPAASAIFGDFCILSDDESEVEEIFSKIAKDGVTSEYKEQAKAGSEFVRRNHTWKQRLSQILDFAV